MAATAPISSPSCASTDNLPSSNETKLGKVGVATIAIGIILLIILGVVLLKMFQRQRRYGGKVLVNFEPDSSMWHNFTVLPRQKPILRSTGKSSLGNKLHGAVAVKAESIYKVDENGSVHPIGSLVSVPLTEPIIFDIELIFNGNTWQVVIAPGKSASSSDNSKLGASDINRNSKPHSYEHLDWSQGKKLSPNWRLEDFSSVARLVGQERGDYCVVTNNCLSFRNAVYRKICAVDRLFK